MPTPPCSPCHGDTGTGDTNGCELPVGRPCPHHSCRGCHRCPHGAALWVAKQTGRSEGSTGDTGPARGAPGTPGTSGTRSTGTRGRHGGPAGRWEPAGRARPAAGVAPCLWLAPGPRGADLGACPGPGAAHGAAFPPPQPPALRRGCETPGGAAAACGTIAALPMATPLPPRGCVGGSFLFLLCINKQNPQPEGGLMWGGQVPKEGPPHGPTPSRLKPGAVPPGGVSWPSHRARGGPVALEMMVTDSDPAKPPKTTGAFSERPPKPVRQRGGRRGLRPCIYSAKL